MKVFIRTFLALILICAFLVPQVAFAAEDTKVPVLVDEKHFPDKVFREFIANIADTDADGALSTDELAAITDITIPDAGVTNLSGIEHFASLAVLACDENEISSLDLSCNPLVVRVTAKGNPLTELKLPENSKLKQLNVKNTVLKILDLSDAPGLIYLACSSPKLTSLDLSALSNLAVLDVRDSSALTSIRPPKRSMIAAHGVPEKSLKEDLSNQKPYLLELEKDATSFDLATLDPDFETGKVADLDGGAKISDSKLKGLAVGQHLTYTYEDKEGVAVPCKIDIVQGNYWIEPLTLKGWSSFEEPNKPAALPKYGEVTYTYGPEGGPFTEDVPSSPGKYIVRATVPATKEYAELTDEAPFEISDDPSPAVSDDRLEAYYGDTLADVALPDNFTWADPETPVGNVGMHTFPVLFTLPGVPEVEMELSVRVLPRPASMLEISPITNDYEANHIVIKDGDTVLIKEKDYFVTSSVDGDEVTVTIEFMGNYTGEIVRKFNFDLENAWIIELRVTGWTYGEEARLPEAEARYGETTYTYAPVSNPDTPQEQIGEFTDAVPQNAGTYVVRATVEETSFYTGLRAEARFVIAKAQPSYTLPQGLQATYGAQLQSIALPTGFTFSNPTQTVGDVGERNFPGVFTPADTTNYETAAVQISVKVNAKDGSNFTLDRITSETQLQNPVVRDGNVVLTRDRDYSVSVTRSGNQYTLTITFIGNYTGRLVRTYNITQTSGNGSTGGTTLTTGTTSGGGTAPVTNDTSNLEANVALLILSAGTAAVILFSLILDIMREKRFHTR